MRRFSSYAGFKDEGWNGREMFAPLVEIGGVVCLIVVCIQIQSSD